jgi:transcriptional repressor NrdR
MRCPFCGHDDTQVKDSRPSDDGKVIRRRRECSNCERRFTTFERFEVQQTVVVKRDGSREMFSSEKLTRSVMLALRKRPVNSVRIEQIVADVEQFIQEQGITEISSQQIGEMVLKQLKEIDFVAYVRYASVYNNFGSIEDFEKILKPRK